MWLAALISFVAVLFMLRDKPEPEPGRLPGLLVDSQPPVNSHVLDNDLIKTPYVGPPQQNPFLQPRPPVASSWLKVKLPEASIRIIEPEEPAASIDKVAIAEAFNNKLMN